MSPSKSSSSEATTPPGFRLPLLLGLVLLSGLLVYGPRLPGYLPNLDQHQDFQLSASQIQLHPAPPRGVPADLVGRVLEDARLNSKQSLLNEELVAKIGRAFLENAWVEKVTKVTKSIPARVDIDLVYRVPVAMVQVSEGFLPVDAHGVLLPPMDFTTEDVARYPRLVGDLPPPRGKPGEAWGEPAIAGAAKLAKTLLPHWQEFQLAAIIVPHQPANQPQSSDRSLEEIVFELSTVGGSRILWGRAPGVVYPGEFTPEQKIGRLEEALYRWGSFDKPDGPYVIDIRQFQEITKERLQLSRPNLPATR